MRRLPQIKAFTPLQAADILVYQMSLVGRQGTPRVTFSYPFDELNRMAGAILQPQRRPDGDRCRDVNQSFSDIFDQLFDLAASLQHMVCP